MIAAVLTFNLAGIIVLTALLAGRVPAAWYGGFLRGLHNTIGITTPNDRQLRWVMAAWIVSLVLIVDLVGFLMGYVL